MPTVVVVVAAATVAALVARGAGDDDVEPAPAIDAVAGRRSAERACRHFAAFLGVVERNGPAREATGALDELVAGANAAAGHDPQWTQLASGAQTLRLGVREDDPGATALAIRLVRQGCEAAG